MFKKLSSLAWASVLAGVLSMHCAAAELGDEAPSLQITNWVKGELLDAKTSGTNRTRVLLFWDTDCDSCRASIPALVELQEKLLSKGVKFVSVCPEAADSVQRFVATNEIGPKINFPIGCDPSRTNFNAYMMAFEQASVPRGFIVDEKNRVVWCGHPLAGMEHILNQIVQNKFDFKTTRKSVDAERLQEEYFTRAAKTPDDAEVLKMGKKIVADGTGNPWLLNNFAWRIEQDSRLTKRDARLAVEASKKACEATDWKRATFIDTYASALNLKGDVAEAIRMEQKALALITTNSVIKTRLEQTLQTFIASRTNSAVQ